MTPDFPKQDLPPLRHQQARALLVREVEEHPARRPLRPRSRRPVSRRFALPATALAVVLAVTGAGLGAHLLRDRPGASADAAMDSSKPPSATPAAGVPLKASATPLPQASAASAAATTGTLGLPDFPRSISAARNATMTAVSQDSDYVELFDTGGATAKRIARFNALDAWTASVALNPDGTLLATSGSQGTVRIWDLSTPSRPRLAQTLTHHTMYVPDLEFSPDGRYLATAGYDNQARVWRVQGDSVRPWRTLPADTDVMAVAFDPDGDHLATATYDRVTLWDLRAASGRQPRVSSFPTETNGQIDVSFNPNGSVLAVGTDTVTLWDLTSVRHPVKGAVLPGTGPAAAFALQWDYLATVTATGVPARSVLKLWKVTGADDVSPIPVAATPGLEESDGRTLAFTADGRALGYTATAGSGVTLGELAVPTS